MLSEILVFFVSALGLLAAEIVGTNMGRMSKSSLISVYVIYHFYYTLFV